MLPPVVKTLTVPLPPDRAFRLFTEQLDRWWPLDSHAIAVGTDRRVERIEVDPRPGGQITEVQDDGSRHPWARITEWVPGRRLGLRWHVGRPEDVNSRIAVDFEVDAVGTRITLTHSGWETMGPTASAIRDSYDRGWDLVLLQRFGQACQPAAATASA